MVRYTLYVEMAANGMFGAGRDGLINAPDPSREYTLSMAEVAVFDAAYYQLLMDLTVITDLAKVRDKIFYLRQIEKSRDNCGRQVLSKSIVFQNLLPRLSEHSCTVLLDAVIFSHNPQV